MAGSAVLARGRLAFDAHPLRRRGRAASWRAPRHAQEGTQDKADELASILETLNYGERVQKLHQFGSVGGAEAVLKFDALGEDTFEAMAALAVARGAGATEVPLKFIEHPSTMVRRYAVSCGLLSAADAKTIFLSPNTSKLMKTMMVRCCPSLPADETTLVAAQRLEGCQAGWALLQRCTDSTVFKKVVVDMYDGQKVPVRLAARFPAVFIELQKQRQLFTWCFKWLKIVAQRDFDAVLRLVLVDELKNPCPDAYCMHIVRWAWRHRTKELIAVLLTQTCRFSLVSMMKEFKAVKTHLTFSEKLEIVVTLFRKGRAQQHARDFVELLPPCNAKRTRHCADLLKGFWEIATLNHEADAWDLFKALSENNILQSPVLVEEFLLSHERVRKKPDLDMFKFMQELPGLDDASRLLLLQKFLGREDICEITSAIKLFEHLLDASKEPAVLRQAFDSLVYAFEGRAVRHVLAAVVEKMSALEDGLFLSGSEGLPRDWVYFCTDPKEEDDTEELACVSFLQTTLLNLAEGPLLDSLVTRFGRCIFWQLLGVVLQGTESPILVQCTSNSTPIHELLGLEPRSPRSNGKDIYFAEESEVKKTTYGKSFNDRLSGYLDLIRLASRDVDANLRVFDDLVPFLVQRLEKEQENVRFTVLDHLFQRDVFSAGLWAANCEHLRAFWESCMKGRSKRDSFQYLFEPLASAMVRYAVKHWETTPGLALEFAVEVIGNASEYIDIYQQEHCRKAQLSVGAIEWLFDHAVPADPHTSLQELLDAMERMAKSDCFNESQENVWKEYSFIQQRWTQLLQYDLEPNHISVALTKVLDHLVTYNKAMSLKCKKGTHTYWWEPVTGDAYRSLVSNVLDRLAAMEMRPSLCISLIRERLQLIERNRHGLEDNALPCDTTREIEATLRIVKCAPKINLREVLWEACLVGEASPDADMVALAALDRTQADQEGRGRLVQPSHEHIKEKLTPDGSCLISRLLHRYLGQCTPAIRATRIQDLCGGRSDAALFLFFGDTFLQNVAYSHQELLHSLLDTLKSPDDKSHEWYHYERPEHALSRVVELAPTVLLHQKTQALLLEKGFKSTSVRILARLPMLEYIDTSDMVSELLAAYPREQSQPLPSRVAPISWEALDSSDIWEEVERRYKALEPPIVINTMQSHEVDTLVLSLGTADHTDRALRSLAQYSSKIKMAKNALSRIIPSLSAEHARRVLVEIVADPGTGVSTRIAMLRLVMELQVYDPQEIYSAVWEGGRCHRDVAAVVLTNIALADSAGADEAAIRKMFDDLKQWPQEDQLYLYRTVLNDIRAKRWALPFLCEIVGSWVYIRGLTANAFFVLLSAQGVEPMSLVNTFTKILVDARLLSNANIHGDTALADEWEYISASTVADHLTTSVQLHSCDQTALRALVVEVFNSCLPQVRCTDEQESDSIATLRRAFRLWAQLLRSDTDKEAVDWAVEEIRTRLSHSPSAYEELASAAVDRALFLHESLDKSASCRELAHRVVDHAIRAVNRKQSLRVLEIWAKLVAAGGSESDLRTLLEAPDTDKIADSLTRILFDGEHRWAALQWFSRGKTCSEAPNEGLRTLAELCAAAVRKDDAELERAIELLESHQKSPECARFVELLQGCRAEVHRRALTWLAPLFPHEAARLYPNLLRLDPPAASDVVVLLEHCEAYGEDVPVIPRLAAAICLSELRSSRLEGARLQAARLLRERGGFSELEEMSSQDESMLVRRVCQAALDAQAEESS